MLRPDRVRIVGRRIAPATPGGRSLLLLHGLASSQRIWDLMVPALARRSEVVTYDARGHGLSSKPRSGYGFDRVTDDALAVIRALRLSRPVVIGHSWGAMVALELAVRRAAAVAGAILVDGGLAAIPWDWATTKAELAPPDLDGMSVEAFLAEVRRGSPVTVTPAIEAMMMSLMRVDRHGRIHPRLSRANHLRILRKIWEQRPLELYARLTVPTLVVAAWRRDTEPWERAWLDRKREAAAAVRDRARGRPVRITWMEGVHDLPVQRPPALARAIERFAARVVG